MYRLFSTFAIVSCLAFVAGEPASPPANPTYPATPEAPTDGPDVNVDGDETDEPRPPETPREDTRPLVDNPQFKSWTAHGVGTSVTNVATVDFAGQKFSIEATQTLLDKNAEEATVETKSVAKTEGRTESQPESKEKVTAKVRQGLEYAPTGFDGKFENAGTETVTVNGKSYDCRIMNFDGVDDNGATVKGRVWVCDDVPGTHVKGEFDMDMEGMSMKFNIMLTSVTLK